MWVISCEAHVRETRRIRRPCQLIGRAGLAEFDGGSADQGHDEVINFCEREQIAFVPYFPLRGSRPGVAAAARRLGISENAVRLAWLLRRSPVVMPIPGTLSIEHVRENLAALELELGEDEIAA